MQFSDFPHNQMKSPSRKAGIRLLPALLLVVFGCMLESEKEARGSVVENEIIGALVTGVGPAEGAEVSLYRSGTPHDEPLAKSTTGADGRFRFTNLKEGAYTLLGKHGVLLSFRDSILIESVDGQPRIVDVSGDTLQTTGSIELEVALRPGDDPASVRGVVLGTAFKAAATDAGSLGMDGMPAGDLPVRITSSLPGYGEIRTTVRVIPGDTTRLGTVTLPFLPSP